MTTYEILLSNQNYLIHNFTQAPACSLFSIHAHSSYEILYFVSGDATQVIEDRSQKIKPGDLIIIPPKCYHYLQIDSPADYERYNFTFTPESIALEDPSLIPIAPIINIANNHIATEIFKKMDYYYNSLERHEFIEVSKLLIKELFYCIQINMQSQGEELVSQLNPLLSNALQYIKNNLYTIKSIDEIADSLFISKSYLFYLFKSYIKRSPKQYIIEKRLLAANELITQGEKPTHVYEKVGFNDYSSFYRNYTKLFTLPPSVPSSNK
jgi:AraC-like DNA-binding protein